MKSNLNPNWVSGELAFKRIKYNQGFQLKNNMGFIIVEFLHTFHHMLIRSSYAYSKDGDKPKII
jgi:hypothetical protein